jgi:hypothetical protein
MRSLMIPVLLCISSPSLQACLPLQLAGGWCNRRMIQELARSRSPEVAYTYASLQGDVKLRFNCDPDTGHGSVTTFADCDTGGYDLCDPDSHEATRFAREFSGAIFDMGDSLYQIDFKEYEKTGSMWNLQSHPIDDSSSTDSLWIFVREENLNWIDCISGSYKDAYGNASVISWNGECDLLGRKMKISITPGCSYWTDCEHFTVENEFDQDGYPLRIAFSWHLDTLLLFNTVYSDSSEWMSRGEQPISKLTRTLPQ